MVQTNLQVLDTVKMLDTVSSCIFRQLSRQTVKTFLPTKRENTDCLMYKIKPFVFGDGVFFWWKLLTYLNKICI